MLFSPLVLGGDTLAHDGPGATMAPAISATSAQSILSAGHFGGSGIRFC